MAAKRRGGMQNILLVDVSRSASEGRETERKCVCITGLLFVSRWSLASRSDDISDDLCEPDAVKEREGIGLGV